MTDTIIERRKPSFGERLSGAMHQGVQALGQYQNQQHNMQKLQGENQAAQRLGIDLSGIQDPVMRQKALQYALESQGNQSNKQMDFQNEMQLLNKRNEHERQLQSELLKGNDLKKQKEDNLKKQEKIAPFQAGLQTIEQMRNLRSKGMIGWGSGLTGIISPETRKDRAEYKTLGNSLISLASTIPIRNKQEFETLTGQLNDPSITLDEMDGVLDALERIITQNMQESGLNLDTEQEISIPKRSNKSNDKKPPLNTFYK